MKKSGLLLISALLAGCHGVTFNSNLGSYTLAKTKTLIVEEYSVAEIAGFNAELLGIIGASYCQARADEGKPSRRALVNELKIKALDLGAGGRCLRNHPPGHLPGLYGMPGSGLLSSR